MKNRITIFRKALAIIAVAAISFGVPWSRANAQNTSTTNDGVPAPTAADAVQAPALPYGVEEVVKLFREGINKDLIITYINNTSLPYHVSPNAIPYLQSVGLPRDITKAMVQRDGQLQQQQLALQQQYDQQQSAPVPNGTGVAPPPSTVVTPTTPPPDVTGIGPDYGDDSLYYDDDSYDYYGAPLIVGGGGWGHGWRRHGWGDGGLRRGYGSPHGGGGGFGGFHGGGGFHSGSGGGHGGGGGHR